MKIEYIAHKGEKFAIEWYYDSRGRSTARNYFDNLSMARQKKLVSLLKTMGTAGKIFNEEKFVNEDDQIYAFKPSPDRFLCFFFTGAKIIITNAYEKKTRKMPPNEKERALRYKDDYTKRIKEGTYYE